LFFQFIANFVYAAFLRQLTNTVLTVALIIGAVIVVAQSYAMNGVDGSWSDLYGGFSRVFSLFFCGVFLFRRWKANPTVDRVNYAPIMVLLLVAVFFCPVPIAFNWLFESLADLWYFQSSSPSVLANRPARAIRRSVFLSADSPIRFIFCITRS
jgi:hypothetical protein